MNDARGVRDQGRDGAPRGRDRPARDRLRVRRCAAHRRQRGHLQDDPEGGRGARRGSTRPSCRSRSSASTAPGCTPTRACGTSRPDRNAFSDAEGPVRALGDGAQLHRRHARARARHDRRPRPAGEQLQAPRPRLRGAGLHRLGADQPLGADPDPADQQGRSSTRTRIELRCPDPSSNPYLAFAACWRPAWTASIAS